MSQGDARRKLGLDPEGRFLLFPSDPRRQVKRHDLALQVARLSDAELLTGGRIEPAEMGLWVNAASAVARSIRSSGRKTSVLSTRNG